MHTLEPHYHWRHLYIASEDDRSPFYGREYSEFEFTNAVYNYVIHPQWDEFGSATLYTKILYADYTEGYAIIEFIGEWNDYLYNDIMFLKREVIEPLIEQGIHRFILLGEYVMNLHCAEDDYYQEWHEEVEDGWIAMVGFLPHVLEEFHRARIDYYLVTDPLLDLINWRQMSPDRVLQAVSFCVKKRLNP